ncbi:MAG: PIG-L family deacetylase [Armatimonadetes bacterium]|nr:PIG-L family deacetylase [Armatimonadota bacterium]
MNETPTIVAVGAHTADMEFTAGATLLKHVRAGWQAHLVHLSLGEKGSRTLSAAEYGEQKRTEAEAAAAALGASAHFLPFRDGEIEADEPTARVLAATLRQLRPQVVITHWHESIHGDHIACHHLTRRALFLAAIRHFDLDGLPPMGWCRTYYAENWEDAEGFEPYTYVDISDVYAEWQAAFRQYAIGRGEGGFPYWDWYEARTRLHGIKLGVRHAAAFAVEPAARWRQVELL